MELHRQANEEQAAGVRTPAVLLLGPTGAGKTPLGQVLEQRGWADRRCAHFDFGENLRTVVRRGKPDGIVSQQDINFLRGVLERGVLLEDRDFPIAERIFRAFLVRREVDDRTVVVLNGLPRHIGQASALQSLVDVEAVVCLECTAETVVQRLRNDPGGDRANRVDDQLPAVASKLSIYRQRTEPLVDWYRQRGTRILRVAVTADMTADDAWSAIGQPPAES
jgi:adenylate kinase family enzyme